jgi:N-acyl homoserine lactone hydrolase
MPKIPRSIKLMTWLILFLLICFVSWLVLPTSNQPEIKVLNTTSPNASDWLTIFNRASPLKYKLIHAGDIHIDRNDLLQNPPKTWIDRNKALPVLSHWVSHPTYGELLFDAAFSRDFKNTTLGNYSRFMNFFAYSTGVRNSLENNLLSQIPNQGKNVKKIFVTHFHPDHTSGLDEFLLSIPVVADVKEYDFLARLLNGDLFDRRQHWQGIDFSQGVAIPPFKRVVDIFGDSSVLAISTPGHTPGHTSYLINSEEGTKLIVGDASHFSFGFDNNLAPAAIGDYNSQLAEDSLSQLRQFHQMYPQVQLILGHELP